MNNVIHDEPLWLKELRSQCQKKPQSTIAKEMGYSPAVINQVLAGKYKGSLDKVSKMVCSLYLDETVICPVMGELAAHRCQQYQQETFSATNPIRVRRYRACRSGCINSELKD